MNIINCIDAWAALRPQLPDASVGFVPTMGNLHDGHASLLQRARTENTHVILSIFVNPTQFNNPDDLHNYPRTLDADLQRAEACGVDTVLLPDPQAIYPDNYAFSINETEISTVMEGAHRPGHFRGMLTVVMKLLMLAGANNAYFGEKDYQQLLLIRKMCQAFFIPTTIIGCPIIREANGLAMSSRNGLLSAEGREKAAILYACLQNMSRHCGEKKKIEAAAIATAITDLQALKFTVDYLDVHWGRCFVAASLEGVRLIDNLICHPLPPR